MRLSAVAAIVFVTATCLATAGARAGELMVVSDSAAIGYARGSIVEEGTSVKIPAGERLALIDANGKGLTLHGPYDGPLNAAATAAPQSPAVLAALKAILNPAVNVSIGAVRKAGEGPQPPDPRLIDVSDSATVCVDPGGTIQLWRPTPTRHTTLVVTRLSTGDHADVDWPANQPTVAWPAAIQIADGESYQLALTGALSKPRMLLKLVPPGETSVGSAKQLADWGCHNQAVTMLEAIAAANER
jgi:hypothetical protein